MSDPAKYSIIKVISGGQTGVDQAGLRAARLHHIKTGGTAPLWYMTEDGPNPMLKNYGVKEATTEKYIQRTIQNVMDCDMALLIGLMKGGTKTTAELCLRMRKRCIFVPRDDLYQEERMHQTARRIRTEAERRRYAIILNIAGTRESKSPGIGEASENFLHHVFGILDGTRPSKEH